jgi:hypothetical protein
MDKSRSKVPVLLWIALIVVISSYILNIIFANGENVLIYAPPTLLVVFALIVSTILKSKRSDNP